MYLRQGKSTHEIARELGVYPNRVRRELLKAGVKLRNHKQAQQVVLTSGRHQHPTKGKKRSEATKRAISEAGASSWRRLTEGEKARRVSQAKTRWEAMSDAQQEAFRAAANDGLRRSAKEGSQLERLLYDNLVGTGNVVQLHKKHILVGESQHLDLFLPERGVVIEVDGPSHYLPIWGEEALQKTVESDNKKNGLIINAGLSIIRLRYSGKPVSDSTGRAIVSLLLKTLNKVNRKKGLIILEANDGA